jgi:tetratricopeptide (TPR) repeat protein
VDKCSIILPIFVGRDSAAVTRSDTLDPLSYGLRQIALQRYESVHSSAIDMIKANVRDPVPYCLLGLIASEHGNHFKACELLERSTSLDPDNGHYQALLGRALTTIGQQIRAKAAADRAALHPVNDAHFADTLGVIYSRTGYHEKAIPFFNQAVALDPRPANFHYNLAASQQFLGNFDKAESAYLATLERDPNAYRAWSSLVGLKRQSDARNNIDQLTALFKDLSDDPDATLHLGHAIAKSLEDMGRYEESLAWLRRAKRLKRKDSFCNPMNYASMFEAAKSTVVGTRSGRDRRSKAAPIFIIGMPRTGTTLVDRIISSHPTVTAAGELNVFAGLIKEAVKSPSNLVMDAQTLQAAGNARLDNIGKVYIENTRDLARGAARFTDKMPFNFFYAGLIHRALPDARIVALRRGAMDSCLSNYRQLLTVQHSYYQYTYDLDGTASFYRLFDDLMAHWREHLPEDRFLEIDYENIVLDQERQTRRLLAFCELDWHEDCLKFHENTAPVSTASSVQVRQPLYSGSIGRWKRYGSKLEELKASLGPLADASDLTGEIGANQPT